MKSTHSEDLEFLRNIKGRFSNSKPQRQSEWFLILLFGVFFPPFSIFVFFAWWPVILDKGHLIVLAYACGTFVGGIYLWRMRAVEYEFTGDEIIERRAGRIKNQIRIADIIETKVQLSPHQLTIKTSSSKMNIQTVPSLNAVIQKKGRETMTSKSEAEQEHFEKVKQETVSRFKRPNVIGAIILVLFGFVIALFIGWFKRKH